MIDLQNKNKWIIPVIEAAGHSVWTHDGIVLSTDDAAVQLIIDTYDPLSEAKLEKIEELKIEGLRRANLIYDDEDKVFASVAAIELLIDIDATYDRSVSPATRLVSVNQLLNTFKTARTAINSLNTLVEIEGYNVTIDPGW